MSIRQSENSDSKGLQWCRQGYVSFMQGGTLTGSPVIHVATLSGIYLLIEENMLDPIFIKYPTVELLNEQKLFIWLLSHEDTCYLY